MDFDQIGPDSQGRLFKNFPSALRREFGKRNLEEYRSEIPLLGGTLVIECAIFCRRTLADNA